MQDVLRTHSLSQALSIKAALELEGITTELFNENALSYMHLAGEIRVMVHEPDEERARALIHALEPTRRKREPITRAWRWERRGIWLMGLALGLFILRFMLEGYLSRQISNALLLAVDIVGALGLLLLIIGLFFLEEKPRSPWEDESAAR
jgi:Putative prokaryotic signal transducing protein